MSLQESMNLRTQIETMTLYPTEPVDIDFCEIDDFTEVAETICNPLTEIQKCKITYIVLQNTKLFQRVLDNWDIKRPQEKTWESLKDHFRNVQNQCRRTGDLTM